MLFRSLFLINRSDNVSVLGELPMLSQGCMNVRHRGNVKGFDAEEEEFPFDAGRLCFHSHSSDYSETHRPQPGMFIQCEQICVSSKIMSQF